MKSDRNTNTQMGMKSENKNPAIFLMGPTASGKTALSLSLAKKLPVEIISVDSAQIYRGMSIGTGKPTAAELAEVPHHLIDIRDPIEPYSAASFAKDALTLMQSITEKGKIPLLVGGTMLYFRALLQGLAPLPSADPIIRARLLLEAQTLGWGDLHQRLAAVDPLSAERIHPNDPQRIQRALEVFEISGKPMSSFFETAESAIDNTIANGHTSPISDYQIHAFAFMPNDAERLVLHQKIEQRFKSMLEQGLINEVEALYNRKDLDPTLPAIRAVGYRQVWQFLAGECNYNEMVFKAIVATRQLAKRQITWLRSLQTQLGIKKVTLDHLASCNTMLHCLSKGEA